MKLKTLLCRCSVDYINIVLRYYVREFDEPDYTMEQLDIEISNRKDFNDFIATYGNSTVEDWTIESFDGIAYMIFDLKKLVKE